MKHLLPLSIFLFLCYPGNAGTLYYTEFEEFSAGDNRWAGTGNWISNDMTSGAQGIIQDPVGDLPLGRAGFLGYSRPVHPFTTVFRSINHDPVASGLPIVHLETLLGVQDSTNGYRDKFHISFYNIEGDFLAAVTFDNTTGTLQREDGVAIANIGLSFLRGDPLLGFAALQLLQIRIDLPANEWSASIDGIPMFTGSTFTAISKPRTIGAVAAEWSVASGSVTTAGNNWLLVADWLLWAAPGGRFSISSISSPSSGGTTITWPAHAGFTYQVSYSSDLVNWRDDLENSGFVNVTSDGVLSFTDSSSPAPGTRFYRVLRRPEY